MTRVHKRRHNPQEQEYLDHALNYRRIPDASQIEQAEKQRDIIAQRLNEDIPPGSVRCPECKRVVPLNGDGCMRKHSAKVGRRRGGMIPCSGWVEEGLIADAAEAAFHECGGVIRIVGGRVSPAGSEVRSGDRQTCDNESRPVEPVPCRKPWDYSGVLAFVALQPEPFFQEEISVAVDWETDRVGVLLGRMHEEGGLSRLSIRGRWAYSRDSPAWGRWWAAYLCNNPYARKAWEDLTKKRGSIREA